jgi:hypothetical protein
VTTCEVAGDGLGIARDEEVGVGAISTYLMGEGVGGVSICVASKAAGVVMGVAVGVAAGVPKSATAETAEGEAEGVEGVGGACDLSGCNGPLLCGGVVTPPLGGVIPPFELMRLRCVFVCVFVFVCVCVCELLCSCDSAVNRFNV